MAVEEVKWVSHYSSDHQILLVGEGNFSFSLSLARSFGSASNIFATSLDPYDSVIIKYSEAKSNLEKLKELGASLSHGVDATNMKNHRDLRMRKFDRVIFNFPHAGFHAKEDHPNMIMTHRGLVYGFLRNAKSMLRAYGQIHVNHKTTLPYCRWNIEELAYRNSLVLIECVDFMKEDYPGYENKGGDGSRSDEPFDLGECSTFKFTLYPTLHKNRRVAEQSQMQNPSIYFNFNSSQTSHRVMLDHNSAGYSQLGPIRERNMNYDCVRLPQRTSPTYRVEFSGINGFNSSQPSCGVTLDHNSNLAIPRLTSFGPGYSHLGHIRERHVNNYYLGSPQRTNSEQAFRRPNLFGPGYSQFDHIRDTNMNYYAGLPRRTRDEFYGTHDLNSSQTSHGVMFDRYYEKSIWRPTSFGLFGRHD